MNANTKTYEQYCTHLGKNVIMEETRGSDGSVKTVCTNSGCDCGDGGCQNKLRKK